MAVTKTSTGKRGAGSIVARELNQLRKRVKELTLRLEREAKAHKLDVRLAAEAKKAREQLTREIKALREHGRKLASELKAVLGDAGKREQALKEARGKVAELRAGLARKTADLKRRSGELKKLAEESAHRAAAIIRGDTQPGAESVQTEPSAAPMPAEPAPESYPSDKPTPT